MKSAGLVAGSGWLDERGRTRYVCGGLSLRSSLNARLFHPVGIGVYWLQFGVAVRKPVRSLTLRVLHLTGPRSLLGYPYGSSLSCMQVVVDVHGTPATRARFEGQRRVKFGAPDVPPQSTLHHYLSEPAAMRYSDLGESIDLDEDGDDHELDGKDGQGTPATASDTQQPAPAPAPKLLAWPKLFPSSLAAATATVAAVPPPSPAVSDPVAPTGVESTEPPERSSVSLDLEITAGVSGMALSVESAPLAESLGAVTLAAVPNGEPSETAVAVAAVAVLGPDQGEVSEDADGLDDVRADAGTPEPIVGPPLTPLECELSDMVRSPGMCWLSDERVLFEGGAPQVRMR